MGRIDVGRLGVVTVVGICLILFLVKWFLARKKKDENDRGLRGTYIMEGMSIGMAAGAALTFTVYKESGVLLIVGMMLGMAVGMFIPKQKQ